MHRRGAQLYHWRLRQLGAWKGSRAVLLGCRGSWGLCFLVGACRSEEHEMTSYSDGACRSENQLTHPVHCLHHYMTNFAVAPHACCTCPVRADCPEATQTLLQLGATFDARCPVGSNALHMASERGHWRTVRVLCKWDADLNQLRDHTNKQVGLGSTQGPPLTTPVRGEGTFPHLPQTPPPIPPWTPPPRDD